MRILDLLAVPIRSGFFSDDQAAIRQGAERDGGTYRGRPITPGFRNVRDAGEGVSVLLILDDGQVASGDCAAVQYSGVGGRDPVFNASSAVDIILEHVAPLLRGKEISTFRELASLVDNLLVSGTLLHTAIRYGVTQAILDAVARARFVTMAEVVRDEYDTGSLLKPVAMFVQSGDQRYDNVDRMILKRADVLPHGLVNNLESKVGSDGQLLLDYVTWVRDRIISLRDDETYIPVLHIDVYGTIGEAFNDDVDRVADFVTRLGDVASPFQLRVEHAIDAGNRDDQITITAQLRNALRNRGSQVQLVVDEWCNTLEDIRLFVEAGAADMIHVKTPDLGGINNTIEALLLVSRGGLLAYCGGTCNETDRSAQVSAHIAMACNADQVLAKPGMGVDEGMMIVGNEMARVAAIVGANVARGSVEWPNESLGT